MKKTLLCIAALLALPALTLAGFGLAGGRAPMAPGSPTGRLLSLAATATAAYAAALAVCVTLADRRLRRLDRELAALRARERDLLLRLQDQRARIDILSAAREVSLILNQDVDFKTILDKVLGITADLLGGRGTEEISIWLRAEENGRLVPRARLRAPQAGYGGLPAAGSADFSSPMGSAPAEAAGGLRSAGAPSATAEAAAKDGARGRPMEPPAADAGNVGRGETGAATVTFDPEPGEPAPRLVAAAYEHGRLITATSDVHLEVALPLVADREIVGILLARTALDGERDEKAERARGLAAHLEEFAKVVALAIKTPDLYTRAVEDALTKLATRRHFRNQLELHMGLARRHGEALSIIMIDIDHFKKINDTYGHLAGDAVLRGVADVILGNLRRTDEAAHSAYRYGGEEMTVILPKTDVARAADAAERLRRQVETRRFSGPGRESPRISVSCGVAAMTSRMAAIDDLIGAADRALYVAKEEGRNRVCVADEEPREKEPRTKPRAARDAAPPLARS